MDRSSREVHHVLPFPESVTPSVHFGGIGSAADYYTAAAIGGANALGRPDHGSLAPGALADITIFDFDDFRLAQFIDPIQTMVLSGSGGDVKTVIVNSRIVVRTAESRASTSLHC